MDRSTGVCNALYLGDAPLRHVAQSHAEYFMRRIQRNENGKGVFCNSARQADDYPVTGLGNEVDVRRTNRPIILLYQGLRRCIMIKAPSQEACYIKRRHKEISVT